MPKPTFKSGHMCIIHPGEPIEFHQLYEKSAFMFFEEEGTSKLVIDHGSDWINFEDSEFIGDSETTIHVWGIPATVDEVELGSKSLAPNVTSDPDQATPSDVIALWFASIPHRVDKIAIDLPGKRRMRIVIHIPDITEESDDPITMVTFDFELDRHPTKIERLL